LKKIPVTKSSEPPVFNFMFLLGLLIGVEDQQPTPINPKPIKIEFPEIKEPLPEPKPSPVVPSPTPTEPPTLSQGKMYVVKSTGPFLLLASPKDLVSITFEKGPIRIRGIFLEGEKYETRNYTDSHIAIVEPLENVSGIVELFAIPADTKEEKDILRILVKVGKGPRPPPTPEPVDDEEEDKPVVDPKPVTPSGFRVIMAFESSETYPPETNNILHSRKIDAYLTANCVKEGDGRPGWRKWDKDVVPEGTEMQSLRDLWNQSKPKLGKLPQLVIAVNGKFYVIDMPPTEDETLTILKKYGGE